MFRFTIVASHVTIGADNGQDMLHVQGAKLRDRRYPTPGTRPFSPCTARISTAALKPGVILDPP